VVVVKFEIRVDVGKTSANLVGIGVKNKGETRSGGTKENRGRGWSISRARNLKTGMGRGGGVYHSHTYNECILILIVVAKFDFKVDV